MPNVPSFVYKSISVLGTSQWPFLKFTSSRINARGVAGTPVPVGGYNFLYLKLILKWSLRAYTCVHVRAWTRTCVHTCVRVCVRTCVHAQRKKKIWPLTFDYTFLTIQKCGNLTKIVKIWPKLRQFDRNCGNLTKIKEILPKLWKFDQHYGTLKKIIKFMHLQQQQQQ